MRHSLPTRILALSVPLIATFLLAAQPSNLPRAIAAQQEILAQHPEDPQAYNDYGNLMLLAGRDDAAEAAYQRAVELAPYLVSARYNFALLLEQRGALKAASAQLDAVLEQSPDHAWAYFQKGRIAERQGRQRQAVQAFAEAFRRRPDLSFPEVNPQVLDSDLVTRALLETRPETRSTSEAPRIYEDPSRIASLLLPQVPAGDEADDETAAERAGVPMATPPPEESTSEEEESGRTLQPGDLPEDSRVGEATPAVPGGQSPQPTRGSAAWIRQQQRLQRQGASPPSSSFGTPGGGGFRPGTRSTGQSRLQVRQDG